MSVMFKFTFSSKESQQVISIDNCNIWSDVVYYNKFLELKLPNAGRARLIKVLHKDLAVEVRNKIRLLSDKGINEFDVDEIYKEVLKNNTKKYFLSKDAVKMTDGRSLIKRVYTDGTNFFYKDQDQDLWVELVSHYQEIHPEYPYYSVK